MPSHEQTNTPVTNSERASSVGAPAEAPASSQWLCVGWVKGAHGLKGDVIIGLRSVDLVPAWLVEQDSLVLDLSVRTHVEIKHLEREGSGLLAPQQPRTFGVTKYRSQPNGLVVKFENINDRNKSEALRGASIWIQQAHLQAAVGEQPFLAEILGFTVFRVSSVPPAEVVVQDAQCLGRVEGFSRCPRWDSLQVRGPKGVVEVPFLDAWVLKMDYLNKRIFMDLPEEFLDPQFWLAGSR